MEEKGKVIVKWAQEDVEMSNNLLNNIYIYIYIYMYIHTHTYTHTLRHCWFKCVITLHCKTVRFKSLYWLAVRASLTEVDF